MNSSPQLLPMDLMMDIFSRLPLKSIAICRCVSKQWASVVSHSGFRDLRLTRSQARPRLLFACKDELMKVFFLSSPQPQSLEASSPVATDYHMSFSFDHPVKDISTTTSLSGFVCVFPSGCRFVNGRKFMVDESVVCNPSTGQSLTTPRIETEKRAVTIRFFGYDPVEKLHKVLAMVCDQDEGTMDHQVLTLGGTEKATWRMTECGIPCSPWHRQSICINGVIYYIGRDHMIVCFGVRSEKYCFVKFPERIFVLVLLDCYGKLALVVRGITLSATSERIEMWVLQDPHRHEWSKLVYILPPMWKGLVDPKETLEIVGVSGPNEFVMSPRVSSDPFHVYYCNFEKETVTRVVIQGMGAFGSGRRYDVRTSLNHVEDVKLMKI